MFDFLHFWPYRHLIFHKAWADFRAESQRNYLGILWWVLDPIINTLIYYLVFGVFLQRGEADFVPYLVTGIVGWYWFFQAVSAGSSSIYKSAPLVRQVSMNKIIFPMSQILTASYKFGFSLLVLFGALFYYGYFPNVYWLLLPLLMAVQFLLLTGVALVLASIVPFAPDLSSLIPYFLRLGFFLSCVMYKLEWLSETAQFYLQFNPMVHILNGYRDVLMYQTVPDWNALAILAVLSLLAVALGAHLITRFSGLYAKRIIR